MNTNDQALDLSIVIPCLNEENTLQTCIAKAFKSIHENNIPAEVVVADNGSTDKSLEIAKASGARVISVQEKGYGSALINGCKHANGRYLIMGDADGSYDFSAIMPFVNELKNGADLVIGNRFAGGIEKGAMPFLHRYLGNPVLSTLGRLFFSNAVRDFHCGLRAIKKEAFHTLNLQCKGMEFASEMIIKAALTGLKIAEVGTTLSIDGRNRKPHLKTWRDGWRHLKLLLIYAPNWLFIYPGLLLITFGTILGFILNQGALHLGKVSVSLNSLLYSYSFIVTGLTLTIFGLIASTYQNTTIRLRKESWVKKTLKHPLSLEIGIIIGSTLLVTSIVLFVKLFLLWKEAHFGNLDPASVMFLSIPSAFLFSIGTQIIFSSFLIKIVRED